MLALATGFIGRNLIDDEVFWFLLEVGGTECGGSGSSLTAGKVRDRFEVNRWSHRSASYFFDSGRCSTSRRPSPSPTSDATQMVGGKRDRLWPVGSLYHAASA